MLKRFARFVVAEDQAIELPPLEERPLVTFALFAYNQEKYIREAVEGAFAQTYEPLEIILSDDCSTDRTFEIMEEMAAEYAGPHRIIARQNNRNLGLINHVNIAVDVASSELIVFAAGDDASSAHRVERIVLCFLENPVVMLVHSQAWIIDEQGNEAGLLNPPITDINTDLKTLALANGIYIGATGAIRKRIFKNFGPITEPDTYEDLTFGFRAALAGTIFYLPEPLVKYRSNIGIASQFRRWGGARTTRRIASIRQRIATLRQRNKDLNCTPHPNHGVISRVIESESAITEARLELYTSPITFLTRFFSKRAYYSTKALSIELKFMIRILN